jgi:diguanylate cyclase (GGDEF)-like protein/PAS domain S-box-containing protein
LRQWLRQPAAWTILGIGAVVSLFAWRSLTLEVEHAARSSFNAVAAESRNAIQSRLRDYRVILLGLQGLLEAKRDLDRVGFERYIENLTSAHSAGQVRSFSYARRVPRALKDEYEKAVRADTSLHPAGYPQFAVRPPGERNEYVVIHYVSPYKGNERGFGLDLMADPERRRVVERTRDTGEIVATGPITLVSTGERAVSMRLAVYRTDAMITSLDLRREMFGGVANITFSVRDVAADIVSRYASSALQLRVLDGGEPLYESSAAPAAAGGFHVTTPLEVGGRSWQLEFSAPPERFRTAGDAIMPWLALLGGLAISVLLAGLVGSLATSTRRARRIAREITEDLRKSQAELAEAQRKTELLIETLPNPVFFKGIDGGYLGVNKAWEAFFKRPRASIIGRPVHDLYPHAPEIAQRMHAADQSLWAEPGTQTYEASLTLPDGTQRDTIYYKATFTGPQGRVAGLIGTIIDITERKQAEKRQAMEHAVTRLLAAADTSGAAIPQVIRVICESVSWTCGALLRWEPQSRQLRYAAGWAAEAADLQLQLSAAAAEAQAGKQALWQPDGAIAFPLLLGGEVLGVLAFLGAAHAPDRQLMAMMQSIGSQVGQYLQRKQAEEALRFVATHDSLTGLPNRVMFGQRLDHAITQAKRHGRRLAVLFIDLDRFKVINDTLGHEFGDTLLRDVAQRLTQSVRASDTIGRLGGDEFVVLLEEVSAPMVIVGVAQKLIGALAQGFPLAGKEYHVSASIGVSTYPDDAHDAQELLKNADIAMYRAKEQGRNTFQFYAAQHNIHTVERLTLESGLRRALERGQLVLHYQPQLDIESDRIVGFEALVRWQHPELGLLPPASFIAIAEETGLIVPIGQWVMHAACATQRAWREAGLAPLRMSVNLSPRQFLHSGLIDDIAGLVRASAADAAFLELEITEGMVMQDPERAVSLLRDVRNIGGVRIAIDDFGTGHSSLAYLKRFPVDNLKIDRSFIADIPADRDDAAITQAIIAMAHSLEMKVIAEGVETQAQYDFLVAQGCDEYQGYFFSKPVPEAQARALLQAPAPGAAQIRFTAR